MNIALLASLLLAFGCSPKWSGTDKGTFKLISNEGGQTLGYSSNSGVKILMVDRLAFKDLNKNGNLDPYEDWRLPVDERAKDLTSKMSVEQIAGLMLYSGHQAIPVMGAGRFSGTYNGKPFAESGAMASALSAEFNAGAGGKISMWPGTLGIAASFDPQLMKQFGEIAAAEYRALGIATALSPQIDLGTEPRWSRFNGTMGEDPNLTTDMARAYVDGFQTSTGATEISGGWGYKSVNAMVKHWPGGGPEEGGRDRHFGYGAYAVYPGNNLKDHLKPFTEGAFKLEGATGTASAVMPYYTISYI